MTTHSNPDSPNPRPEFAAPAELHEMIRRRAEEVYIRGGRVQGRDVENWAQAESEVLSELAARPAFRTAIVINVNGVQYMGEYTRESGDGYRPGEFLRGEPVPVRFEGDKMFVTRPNGRELVTTLVNRIG